jgi:dUTP pyrophosphatase
MITVTYKKLNPNAVAPQMAKPGDACYDLCATSFEQIGDVIKIGTGLAFAIPEGYEGQVRSRSGLGLKGIHISHGLGTIDSGYRGEVFVLLSSLGRNSFLAPFGKALNIGNTEIKIGDRVGQLAIRVVPKTQMTEVAELDETDRGDTGFGSSGLQQLQEAKPKASKSKG